MNRKSLEQVLREHRDALMSLPGVVGTALGLCDGRPCIKVLVGSLETDLVKRIPSELDDYTVSVEEVGEIQAPPP